jgi:2-amino-4-hydroxy-6-hydroxymethyldihydropteridine diphosphokinase
MTHRAFIAVGSNLQPEENIRQALRELAKSVRIAAVSTVYLTEPLLKREQPSYYNGVIEVTTDIPPRNLKFDVLHAVEASLGRKRVEDKYASRTIDLDLILYDDLAIASDDLTLPDPDIVTRAFIAWPLFEIAPDFTLPGDGRGLREVVEKLDRVNMMPLEKYTASLKKEFLLNNRSMSLS